MPEPIFLDGENPDEYASMWDQVRAAVHPSDFIEEVWVRDVVDLTWEAIRYRRMKAAFLNAHLHDGLEELLRPLLGLSEAREAAEGWARRDPEAIESVKEVLEDAGRSLEEVRALTLRGWLRDVERFDRLIAGAEARRNSVLREVDRRRAAFALALRSAATPIEDADYSVLSPVTAPIRAA
ncbi:hypothetical protein JNW90_31130 [Micromonospora sp. STR1s_5]|nr:hypothetical protein [Micromonospora sp. STR1s_5]